MERVNNNIIRNILKNYDYYQIVKHRKSKNSLLLNTYKEYKTYFPLTDKISKYNQDYICHVIAYEFTHDYRLIVHILENGDMSFGSIQDPNYSKLIQLDDKLKLCPIDSYFYEIDNKKAYGYLVYDFKKLNKGKSYGFKYGSAGYSCVKIFELN